MEISYEKILHRPMGSKVKVIVTANVSQDGTDWDYRAETYELDGWVDPVVRAKNREGKKNILIMLLRKKPSKYKTNSGKN